MKIKSGNFSRIIIFGGMAMMMSCNLPTKPSLDQEILLKYSTISVLLTETAEAGTSAVSQATLGVIPTVTIKLVQFTLTPTPPVEPIVTKDSTSPWITNGPGNSCDIAQAGKPIDITIPDDTHLYPGQYFTKTWRLVNNGTCSWTQNYAVVWFSGDDLGLSSTQFFSDEVAPGNSVDITLDMIAPLKPGTYQSNWKLRNNQGNLFGIGPHGDAPFWVKILVIPEETTTPTPVLSLPSPTPAILASGTMTLQLNQKADLDSGLVEQPQGNDLAWKNIAGDHPGVVPENGAKFAIYGEIAPEIQDCLKESMSERPFDQDQLREGLFICYRTTAGLPGRFFISKLDLENDLLDLEFVTWIVP